MAKWEVIDLAPKDGRRVDLWIVPVYVREPRDDWEEIVEPRRVCDCRWCQENGMWIDAHEDAAERPIYGGALVATHWVPSLGSPL